MFFTFSGDLKLLNIVSGLMSCASKHPCYICDAEYQDGRWSSGHLRTFESIKGDFKEWITNGSKMSKAKDHNNCIQLPLLGADDAEKELLFLVPPPALHLKLGLNHVLKKLQDVWPDLRPFLQSINIIFEPYHGETLGKYFLCIIIYI